MPDKFHREDGFSAGPDKENPTFTVDRNGSVRFDGSTRLGGALSTNNTEFVMNEAGADMDWRAESDTNANALVLDAGQFTGVGNFNVGAVSANTGFMVIDNPAFTAAASTNIAKLNIENGAAITVPAGTTDIAASVFIGEPNLTATGTITQSASLYVEAAATEATRNYSLYVDAGVSRFDGVVVITAGTNLTTPTGLTQGLFIEQAGNDDDIIQLSSTDVTHGVTTVAPTNSYCTFGKFVAASAGLDIEGISSAANGVYIRAIGTATATDPPTTTSVANFQCVSAAISGTGVADLGAGNPMFQVVNNATNGFVVMADGELYSNQSATVGTFDAYEDALACKDLSYVLSQEHGKIIKHNREVFEQMGILGPLDEKGQGLYSLTKMNMLMLCAIGQIHTKLANMVVQLQQQGIRALPATGV